MTRLAVCLAVGAASLALAAPAGAASLLVTNGVATYTAADGKVSVVVVSQVDADTVRFALRQNEGHTDTSVTTQVGNICHHVVDDADGNRTFDCHGVTSVVASGAELNDTFRAPTVAVPVTLAGGPGSDTLTGGPLDDLLEGGEGNDSLLGVGGTDMLRGGSGNDSLDGGAGTDDVAGEDGHDYVGGGGGVDVIVGGPGDDTIAPVADSAADDVRGGAGLDSLVVCVGGLADILNPSATNPNQQVSLDDVANDGYLGEGDNVHTDVEDLAGCPPPSGVVVIPNKPEGREFLTGSAIMNSLAGNQNDDQITGGDGNDFVFGNGGNDVLDTRDGYADRADCGPGDADTARVDTFDQVRQCETVDSAEVAPRGPGTDQVPAADDKPPTVAFTAPASGATLSTGAPNVLSATATDDKGVTQVVFLAGERVLCTVAAPPYTCAFSPLDSDVGKAVLEVIAYDAAQQTAVAVREVKVPRFTPALSAATTPKRDATSPYRFTTRGKVTLPNGVTATTGCSGTVAVVFKAGKKTISTRRVSLRKDCTYSSKVSFSIRSRLKPKTLRVGVTYRGNAVLLPATAKAATVRTR